MSNGGAHRERDRITIPKRSTASPRLPRQFGSDFRTLTVFVCCKRGDYARGSVAFAILSQFSLLDSLNQIQKSDHDHST
jgi:hypothetical protein